MLEFNKDETRLWRNSVGFARTETGSLLHFGLCKGSSDLIGITEVEITPEMVGRKLGVFTAIEVKDKGKKPTKEQKNFIEFIKSKGGLAGVARSNKDVEKIVKDL